LNPPSMRSVRACPQLSRLVVTPPNIGDGLDTKFDVRVRQKERQLRHAIITYIGTASDFTGEFAQLSFENRPKKKRSRAGNYCRFVTGDCDFPPGRTRFPIFRYIVPYLMPIPSRGHIVAQLPFPLSAMPWKH